MKQINKAAPENSAFFNMGRPQLASSICKSATEVYLLVPPYGPPLPSISSKSTLMGLPEATRDWEAMGQ